MKKKYSYLFVVSFLIALLALSACGKAPIKTESSLPDGGHNLSVSGTGYVVLAPDMARITIGVKSESPDISSAVEINNQQAAAITQAVQAQGVATEDLQTVNFNVYTYQPYSSDGTVTETRFSVENTVYVIVRDLSKLSHILDAAISAGANNIYGISFDVQNRQAALDQARDLALADAAAKAKATAASLGLELGAVYSVSLDNNSYVQSFSNGMGGGDSMVNPSSSVPVSAGQIVISYQAQVAYLIR